MIESAQNLQAVILGLCVGGSAMAGIAVLWMLRNDAPQQRETQSLDDIIRDAPYDGLENVLKVAKS